MRSRIERGICAVFYSGTSLIKDRALLGPYSSTVHKSLWWVPGGDRFLMSEVTLYSADHWPWKVAHIVGWGFFCKTPKSASDKKKDFCQLILG